MPSNNFLSQVRIQRVVAALQDVRMLQQPLRWSQRILARNASDDEITMQFVRRIVLADIINDDQAAGVSKNARMRALAWSALNLKKGHSLTQSELRMYHRLLQANGTIMADGGAYLTSEASIMADLNQQVLNRREQMTIGMVLNSWSYSKLGVQTGTLTFGTPSDLLVTTSVAWDNTSATPVTDLLTMQLLAQVRYGIVLDRATMSRTALNYAVATTEFQNKSKPFLTVGLTLANYNTVSTDYLTGLFERVTGFAIELADETYWDEALDGTLTAARYQPITKVILTTRGNDGNLAVWDWANGEVLEPLVGRILGVGGFGGGGSIQAAPTYGPVGYYTGAADLNPPNLTYWVSARGIPRKHVNTASAVLTVGSFTDSIAMTEPTWP